MGKGAMGSKAALDEAVSLWGKRAAIQHQAGVYKVGIVTLWRFWTYGQGKSWRAAFNDYYTRRPNGPARIPGKASTGGMSPETGEREAGGTGNP